MWNGMWNDSIKHRKCRMELEYETYPTENVIVPTLPKPMPWFKLEEIITQAVCGCFIPS